jgi:hypothetical protein
MNNKKHSDDLSGWGGNGGNEVDEGSSHTWEITREKILMVAGLFIATTELVISVVDPAAFHYEFLIFGGSLCGISIAQWGDKKH